MATSQEVSNLAIYKVRGYQNAAGEWIQINGTDKFPEVPGAVSCAITYDGSNQPTVLVYKNVGGTTLATKTLTWVAGNCTAIVWT